ncbi:hypothetical protein J3R30DRAFT_3693352 [Lentinula aciculospora]|uniref:Uncharacterized protein n=1 Tax=Lentinula aciculospora TaxID=153920 RepID=A0A9W9AT41_9AGAR|nr:hypothetical protein J3R30DRAFT_3693352 [Lentinula aciculospora]
MKNFKDCTDSESDFNLPRRIPNEISGIIIGFLVDDLSTLRNVALLCHDFASLAQSHIFRQVDLKDDPTSFPCSRSPSHQRVGYLPLIYRFAALLDNTQTLFLGQFVRRLDVDPCLGPLRNVEQAELDVTISSIFQRLPSLIELRIKRDDCKHFEAIQMYLGKQLKELWIGHMMIYDQEDYDHFQNMLTSLTVITFLAIHDWSLGHKLDIDSTPVHALILPRSLKSACITGTNEYTYHALALGLESPRAPVLSSFLSDFRNEVEDRSSLWKGLGAKTAIALDVGNMMYWPTGSGLTMWNRADPIASYLPAMISVTQGLKGPQLTLICSQLYLLIAYFAHFISILPEPVHRICIDFNAGATDGPPDRHREDWAKLDSALRNRHTLGLLESICVRCTTRIITGNGPSFERGLSLDRTILNRVVALLHRSEEAGILEVDHTTLFFEF